jgi:hypothetical protein
MAEIKNTFIQSKMNKDLDGRILPNGQYRDGRNIQISRSEGDDVGALENALGNVFLQDFGLTDPELEIIGHYMDDNSNTIFLFITNYTDSSFNQLAHSSSGIAGESYIISYNTVSQVFQILIQGNFLNFSKTHPVLGINLLETLLFWTDNRNQPRKIDISLAEPGYYTNEDQISVSKYYPYEPISLLDKGNLSNGWFNSTMKDKSSKYLPIHAAASVVSADVGTNQIVLNGIYTNIQRSVPGTTSLNPTGDKVTGTKIEGDLFLSATAVGFDFINNQTTITVQGIGTLNLGDLEANDILYFQKHNPDYDRNWPGDPDYLKSRFARFSYRFRFDDNEYSLLAPFTQIAFVPEQDGYFIGSGADVTTGSEKELKGQEAETFDSTIVRFMQNKINDIGLNIYAPTIGNENTYLNWNEVNDYLKIKEIDIIYKEADSNAIRVVDTLLLDDFTNVNSNVLKYEYQSRKPWKTLSEEQSTRVNDVVPIRALAQETSGNRIIYGNFIDKHTSPINLNYTIQVNEKPPLPTSGSEINDKNLFVRKEYQNHTLKQNRTYQVGVILSDRYGRQSNVILSKILFPNSENQSGSTFYHRYKSVEDAIIADKYPLDDFSISPTEPYTWPGDQLAAVFYSIIPEAKTENGYPGVYSVADGTVANIIITTYTGAAFPTNCGPFTGTIEGKNGATAEIVFYTDNSGNVFNIQIVNSSTNWSNGQSFILDSINTFPGPGCNPGTARFQGIIETPIDNPLGWYSYKFVVKQTEQEYYNVYLPYTLAGYPCDVTGVEASDTDPNGIPSLNYPNLAQNETSHIVLFGDNVNKVPRDLQEVGPVQDKFRSSIRLYGRVENIFDFPQPNGNISPSNRQYDPENKFDIAVEIGSMTELGLGDITTNPATPIIPSYFYKGETNPLIARIETNKQFGWDTGTCTPGSTPPNDGTYKWTPVLSIYETEPVESLLDIFWETSTSGLISDLNFSIVNDDNTVPVGLTSTNINWNESDWYGTYISSTFEAIGANGQGLGSECEVELVSVTRGDGASVTTQFELEEQGAGTGEYQLKLPSFTGSNYKPLFLCWEESQKNVYQFEFKITRDNGIDPVTSITVFEQGSVSNTSPVERGFPSRDELHELSNPALDTATPPKPINETPPPSLVYRSEQGKPVSFGAWFSETGNAGYQGCEINFGVVKSMLTDFLLNAADIYGLSICENDLYVPNAKLYPMVQYTAADNGTNCENCGATPNTPPFTWRTNADLVNDGLFQVFNGQAGSNVGVFPPGVNIAEEVVYTIPRMYQISTYTNLPGDTAQCGPVEVIFGSSGIIDSDLPSSPIYWANDTTQLDQFLGEETVGWKYNNGFHYWPDLQCLIEEQSASTDPNDWKLLPMMQLQNGSNTFYQLYQDIAQLGFWSNQLSNASGFKYYLGGIDNNGLGDPNNKRYRFNAFTNPVTIGADGYQQTRKGGIFVGDNSNGETTGSLWQNGDWSTGNGLPGGRYVVTLRATDRSVNGQANAQGGIWEWDVPIWLPPWRAGLGHDCVKCN